MDIVEPSDFDDLACERKGSPGSCYVVKWIEGKEPICSIMGKYECVFSLILLMRYPPLGGSILSR